MKKKVVALFLTAAMIASALTGCGDDGGSSQGSSSGGGESQAKESQESEAGEGGGESQVAQAGEDGGELEPVTLRVFFIEGPAGDEQLVADYINDLPQVKALNVTIEICKEWNWDRSQLPLKLAGDEQMDIGWDDGSEFISRVNQQAYTDISPYLENDPDFYNAIPEALWKGTTLNGGIYGVPTYKEIGEQWALNVNKADLEACGMDISQFKTLEDMEPFLAATKEKGLGGGVFVNNYSEWMKVGLFNTYDFTGYNLGGIKRSEGTKVVNLYETQEFSDLVHLMYRWNQAGYIPDEMLTDPLGWRLNEETNEGHFNLRYMGYAPLGEAGYLPKYEVECVFLENPIITNDATRGSIFGIYRKCKNPERAYQFLKLWNTDPEIKNAFVWGVPGVHYNLVDGQVELITNEDGGRSFVGVNFASGNVLLSYTTVDEPKDKYERYEAWNQTAVPASDLGIVYDYSQVTDKVTNCTAVLDEYLLPLLLGFVDPDGSDGIANLQQKLKDAGIEEVIAQLQTQLDAFKAEQ